MIIDVHVHPVLFGPICTDSDRVNFRKKAFGLYKSSPVPMEQVMAVMDHAGVDRAVILAEDYSASMGQPIVSNEEVKRDRRIVSGTLYRLCQCRSARGMCDRKTGRTRLKS